VAQSTVLNAREIVDNAVARALASLIDPLALEAHIERRFEPAGAAFDRSRPRTRS